MSKAINTILLCTIIVLAGSLVYSQKRTSRGTITKHEASSPRAVCEGQLVPKGFVIVGYRSSATCGQKAELLLTSPADTEVVCDGSPIPEGYHLTGQQASDACNRPGSNPLNNALGIARDGLALSPQTVTQNKRSATTVYRSPPAPRPKPSTNESADSEGPATIDRPSRNEIEIAVRRATVLIGMEMQDVSRAWGSPRTNDKLVEETGLIHIWGYKMGRVYFRNGIVYKIELLKGY